MLPFRTADNRIDGATIVAVDIDLIRRSHELIEARDYALAIVQAVREPLVVLDADCRVGLANDAFYALFGETADQIEGKRLWDTGRGIWSDAALRQALKDACAGKRRSSTSRSSGSSRAARRTLVLNTRAIDADRTARRSLLLSVEDVTDARQAEALRIDAETLRLLDKRKDEFLGILAHELRNPLAPMRFALEMLRRSDGDAGRDRAGAAGARPPGHAHGPHRRRSARRVAHHAGQGRAAQGAARAGERRQRRRRALPARRSTRRATPSRFRCPTRRSRSTAIRSG